MANCIAEHTHGDTVKIETAVPYTGSYNDVAYGRAKEEHDSNARPEVAQSTYDSIDMSKYNTVFVGYPIWWWTTPMIIATFFEYYEWTSEINIYPFSQSASMDVSQFDTSMEQVRTSANGATVHDGLFARASDRRVFANQRIYFLTGENYYEQKSFDFIWQPAQRRKLGYPLRRIYARRKRERQHG